MWNAGGQTTNDLEETLVNIAALPLSPDLLAKLDAYTAAQAKFGELREHHQALQAKADRQNALAAEAEAEAAAHKEAISNLIRSDSGDQDAIRALTTKQDEALSLAAHYRKFAGDILAEQDALKPAALVAADDYYAAWEKALSSCGEAEFQALLSNIETRLLQAVKLRELVYTMVPNLAIGRLNNAPDHLRNATDAAFADVRNHLLKKLADVNLDTTSNDTLAALAKRPNLSPFKLADLGDALSRVKRRQAVIQPLEMAQSG
jgi:hypothetical protein